MVYIDALIADLMYDLERFQLEKPSIHSIFIGGGTPSLFSAHAFEKLFKQLHHLLSFDDKTEVTLEANPGTFEQQRFRDYRSLGINRLSLGIQSFNSSHLKALGRIHDDTQAHHAIASARAAGFDTINLDLMHSLPKQSLEEGMHDLQTAIDYQPEHISWYQLTLEPNTYFFKYQPHLPSDDESAILEEQGFSLLEKHGYQRYEISAFSKPAKNSHHNLNYWLFGDYLGIGAGAHGKITSQSKIFRTQKTRQPKDYMAHDKSFLVSADEVTPSDLLFEYMLNTSRLEQAISKELFKQRTHLPYFLLEAKLKVAEEKGMIVIANDSWQITQHGRQFTNDLQALFLP